MECPGISDPSAQRLPWEKLILEHNGCCQWRPLIRAAFHSIPSPIATTLLLPQSPCFFITILFPTLSYRFSQSLSVSLEYKSRAAKLTYTTDIGKCTSEISLLLVSNVSMSDSKHLATVCECLYSWETVLSSTWPQNHTHREYRLSHSYSGALWSDGHKDRLVSHLTVETHLMK